MAAAMNGGELSPLVVLGLVILAACVPVTVFCLWIYRRRRQREIRRRAHRKGWALD